MDTFLLILGAVALGVVTDLSTEAVKAAVRWLRARRRRAPDAHQR